MIHTTVAGFNTVQMISERLTWQIELFQTDPFMHLLCLRHKKCAHRTHWPWGQSCAGTSPLFGHFHRSLSSHHCFQSFPLASIFTHFTYYLLLHRLTHSHLPHTTTPTSVVRQFARCEITFPAHWRPQDPIRVTLFFAIRARLPLPSSQQTRIDSL